MAILVMAMLLIGLIPTRMAVPIDQSCTKKLLALSLCLPYVASPPNNRSSSPSPTCCPPLRASAHPCSSGDGCEACLCVVLRNSSLFGFPIDNARFLPLVSQCHLSDQKTPPDAYLGHLCKGFHISTAVPPESSPPEPGKKNSGNSPAPTDRNSSCRLSPGIAALFIVSATAYIISTLAENSF